MVHFCRWSGDFGSCCVQLYVYFILSYPVLILCARANVASDICALWRVAICNLPALHSLRLIICRLVYLCRFDGTCITKCVIDLRASGCSDAQFDHQPLALTFGCR
jgi:hypothetical protein